MAAERLSMRKIREILRLRFEKQLGFAAISRSCAISPATAYDYVFRAKAAKLSWPLTAELDDDARLNALLFQDGRPHEGIRAEPDFVRIHQELRRKHVTLQLLWQEYRESNPDGYQYSRFTELYSNWAKRVSVTMRQSHRAGEKLFIDFSGDGLDITDPNTGECVVAKLFLAVLGASSYTYAEPVLSEDLPTWVGCHIRASEYFEGVAEIWVPDNLKSGVTKPNRYEPDINPTYAELATHYGAAVIPARVRKPRDKAKVEQGVLLAERWILAVLRHRTFFALEELREAVKPLLEKLNNRPMRKLKKSRRQFFEEIDRPSLKPLPSRPYEFAHWKRPKVYIDYHVEFAEHFYSVPYPLVGKQMDVRATETVIEIFFSNNRITSHVRSYEKGRYTTKKEHMPKGHQAQGEWTPERLIEWAKKTGISTAQVLEEIMRRRAHPQQGFKACMGILHLKYEPERIEAACARAVRLRAFSYKSIAAILKNNLDRQELWDEPRQQALPLHGNVRGPGYYH